MNKTIDSQTLRDSIQEFFPVGPHVTLFEVNNGVGGGGGRRFADAVILSVWPSRGLWIAGCEIKISRSDWLRELKDPKKSILIQKHCKHWWLVTAPGVVQDGEIPDAWGHLEYDPKSKRKGKLKVLKQAPDLEPEPLGLSFTCSMMRNWMEGQVDRDRRKAAEVEQSVRSKYGDAADRIDELQKRCRRLEAKLERLHADENALAASHSRMLPALQALQRLGVDLKEEKVRRRIDAVLKMDEHRNVLTTWRHRLEYLLETFKKMETEEWD